MDLGWERSFKLEYQRREVVGLDIGSSTVKMVQLRKDRAGYAITAASAVDIAPSEAQNNRKEINTIRAIRECLQSSNIRTRLAVCSVCGPEVAVRAFKFPLLSAEEIEGAVKLESSQVCPFNVDKGAIDYQLTSVRQDDVSGVLVAATNKLIQRKRRLAKNASLNCVLMDVDGLALLNCFSEYAGEETGRTTAILNVGSSYTTLAIVGDNSLPFIRDIAYAGDAIVERIASGNGVSREAVSRILSGRGDASRAQLELGDSFESACQKLIVDVGETLRYYAAQEKSAFVEKILVCGGFALVNGFVELLDSRLPAGAVSWNPFDKIGRNVSKRWKDILAKKGPSMAVAAGLAMRSI